MKDGIVDPVVLLLLDIEGFEKIFLTLEIGFDGREQQTLSESAWTRQEIMATGMGQAPNLLGLIHVQVTIVNERFEVLHPNREILV